MPLSRDGGGGTTHHPGQLPKAGAAADAGGTAGWGAARLLQRRAVADCNGAASAGDFLTRCSLRGRLAWR
ncbi:hypothetical protein G6F50_018001 [Rhizopus delemar]|uniref:Uncharacterized protein n=1 Tax=Rhizopus delemar TaxID=936053 RepID=A0A9P6XNN4_9FUNG|nr:hypothetical protein G6F50_018001 [Rhizopus delemar]